MVLVGIGSVVWGIVFMFVYLTPSLRTKGHLKGLWSIYPVGIIVGCGRYMAPTVMVQLVLVFMWSLGAPSLDKRA